MQRRRLYPDYILIVAAAALVAFEAIIAAALMFPPRIGRAIDFTAQYQPKPEWYFLWIYQLLRYFPGRSAFLGAVVLPVFFALLFILMPYLDRGPRGRAKALAAGVFLLAAAAVLTILSTLNR